MSTIKSTEPVTRGAFFYTHLGVYITIAIAVLAGAVAWGQTKERVSTLSRDQQEVRESIHELQSEQKQIRSQQSVDSKTLGVLKERSEQNATIQQRILNNIEKLDDRLDNGQ